MSAHLRQVLGGVSDLDAGRRNQVVEDVGRRLDLLSSESLEGPADVVANDRLRTP